MLQKQAREAENTARSHTVGCGRAMATPETAWREAGPGVGVWGDWVLAPASPHEGSGVETGP